MTHFLPSLTVAAVDSLQVRHELEDIATMMPVPFIECGTDQ